MKSYVVGGAVRDRLLGLPVADRDHVVVGATVDDMAAAGFQPVGRDFPVFLHPVTHEEYALARTERKVAPGYAGFVFHADPSVTLEADLERRDLTINAMAEDDDGTVIDPFGGRSDLAARLFRHVGPAFVEDPVRLLRVARFAARFTDFAIAPDTLALMRRMTSAGEVDALVPERVWRELARGLMERTPSRMVEVLRDGGALVRLLPELDALFASDAGRRMREAVDRAARADADLDVRFAVLVQWCDARDVEALCGRLAVPRGARDVALIAARERSSLVDALGLAAPIDRVLAAMERADAFRRPPRFLQAIDAVGQSIEDAEVRATFVRTLARALAAATSIDAGTIARDAAYEPARIAVGLRAARAAAITAAGPAD